MVDALQKAWRALRPGGFLVDLQPDRDFAARVAVLASGQRATAGEFVVTADEAVTDAGRAVDRVIARRAFRLLHAERVRYRSRFRSLRDFDLYLGSREVRPRLAPGARARLVRLWRSAPRHSLIEIERHFSLRILRRVGSVQRNRVGALDRSRSRHTAARLKAR